MSETVRKQMEQTVMQYLHGGHLDIVAFRECCPVLWRRFVDDLCALVKEPDEEAFEAISRKHGITVRMGYLAFSAEVMAWARGETPRGWCEHIWWDDRAQNWYTKSGLVCVEAAWDICPVQGCRARRPT